jgi:hypothetical protein
VYKPGGFKFLGANCVAQIAAICLNMIIYHIMIMAFIAFIVIITVRQNSKYYCWIDE